MATKIWILTVFVFVLFASCIKLHRLAHLKETPKIYFHVYKAKSSPHNQNRYAHGPIVSREKCYFLKVFLILWKNEMESPIFLHDKYDLYDVCFHLNIYTATFLFDWWLLCWPEIWHWIFLPIQVSQYVLWDHNVKLPNPIAWPYNVVN